MFLRRLLRHKCEVITQSLTHTQSCKPKHFFQEYNIENPFNTDTDFHSLSLRTKVLILNYLCDFRLDSADVETTINEFESNSLRIEPLGYDALGSVYWYFYGTRLYREDFRKNHKKSGGSDRVWQVICFSEQDWQNLANKFKNSTSRKEAALYKTLVEDFLPDIPVLFKAKEAERRRRYVESSRIFFFLTNQQHRCFVLDCSNVDRHSALKDWSNGRKTRKSTKIICLTLPETIPIAS